MKAHGKDVKNVIYDWQLSEGRIHGKVLHEQDVANGRLYPHRPGEDLIVTSDVEGIYVTKGVRYAITRNSAYQLI